MEMLKHFRGNPSRLAMVVGAVIICTLVLPFNLRAEELSQKQLRFSGFTTIGLVKGGNDILGFTQDLNREGVFDGNWSAKNNSNLGIQLDASFNQQWSAGFQMILEDRFENDLEKSISWAFIRYRFSPNSTIKLGRITPDLYMLSEYRKIGFAYLWVRPPVEFYSPLAFDWFDGFDYTYTTIAGSGTLFGKIQLGQTTNTFSRDGDSYELSVKPAISFSLNWENDTWGYRASIVHLTIDTDEYFPGTEPLGEGLEQVTQLWPQAESYRQSLNANDASFKYFGLGAQYTPERWQIQAEVNHILTDLEALGDFSSGYVSVGRHFGSATLYSMVAKVRSSKQYSEIDDAPTLPPPFDVQQPQLDLLEAGLNLYRQSIPVDQHTLSIGMRWDIRYDLALKLQVDRSWVSAYASALWDQKDTNPEDETLNAFTINLNYVF